MAGVSIWSTTAATNATVDSTVNWREGQAASTVNNSARAMMAAIAKWRDDIAGNLLTGGSSTAYTITSNQSLTPLVDGYTVTARMHATSGAAPTLNVDSTGAKAIRVYTSTALPTGAVNGGSVQTFTYDSGDDCWYVGSFFSTTTLPLTGLLLHDGTELTTPATDDELAIYDLSTTTNKRITLANIVSATTLAATETTGGFVEKATDAEIRAATTGAKAVMAEDLESASAFVTISDGATITPDWDAFINGTITMSGNRALALATNIQTGTWRTIWVQGNDGTDRTISLGAGYLGTQVAAWNALTFNSSTKRYILPLFALSTSAVLVGAPQGPF